MEPRLAMRFTIRHVGTYLRGDLYHRKTGEETREFLEALAKEALQKGVDRVLICVHSSRAVFRADAWGLAGFLKTIASRPAHRIAAVADSYEGRLAQQYVATLAWLRASANVKTFRSEQEAIEWLKA